MNTGSTTQNLEGFPDLDEHLEANALEVDSIWWCNHVQLCLEYDMQHEQVGSVDMKISILNSVVYI